MTARSKVTLVEAQQIREHLVEVVRPNMITEGNKRWEAELAVDALLALGLIDTDAALRLVANDE